MPDTCENPLRTSTSSPRTNRGFRRAVSAVGAIDSRTVAGKRGGSVLVLLAAIILRLLPFSGAATFLVAAEAFTGAGSNFDAGNPGRWPLHCHNLMHMATGMMTEIVYDRIT